MHGQVNRRRSLPYPGAGKTVHVPAEVWEASVVELRRYASARSEALVFWGGVVCGDHLQVTGLYLLGHAAQGSRVKLEPEETKWLLRELRRRDEKLIAQFHSHPGDAYHSGGDDDHAAAFHEGLLSIVAPHHAVAVQLPIDCAVHEYRDGEFRLLPPTEVSARLHMEPWTARRRQAPEPAEEGGQEEGWLVTLVSNLRQRLTGPKRR